MINGSVGYAYMPVLKIATAHRILRATRTHTPILKVQRPFNGALAILPRPQTTELEPVEVPGLTRANSVGTPAQVRAIGANATLSVARAKLIVIFKPWNSSGNV